MLPPLLRVRDAHLRPDGIMIPREVTWRGALIVDRSTYEQRAFFDTRPYDIDFSLVRDWAFAEVTAQVMQPSQLSTAFRLDAIDMATVREEPTVVVGESRFAESLVAYGFCGWFDANLSPSVNLETGPAAPPTHWRQLVFPFPRPIEIRANEPVSVRVRPVRFEGRAANWHWSVATTQGSVDWDDFSYRAHIFRRTTRE
jgi:protein arginine N-methyltransferase 1